MTQDPYLNTQELLQRSWQEVKTRFTPFFLLALGSPLLSWLLNGLLFGFNGPLNPSEQMQLSPVLTLFVSLLTMLISLTFTSALALLVCKQVPTVGQALKAGLLRVPRLLGGTLVMLLAVAVLICLIVFLPLAVLYVLGTPDMGLGIAFGLLLLIACVCVGVGLIYLTLWPFMLILTDEPFWSSLSKAFALVKGYFWRTFGLLLVLGLINVVLSGAALLAGAAVSFLFLLVFPGAIWIASLLWVCVAAVSVLITQIPLIALFVDRSSHSQQAEETQP